MAICKLCLKEKDLCKSHIYPEFLYKALYDDHHSYFAISAKKGKHAKRPKKGIYDKLLCKGCESLISRYEDYAKKAVFGELELTYNHRSSIIEVSDIDYKKFKLFLLSLLWRASIHYRSEMPKLDLGPHQEILRNMILNEDPGKFYEYGVMLSTVNFDKEFLDDFIFPLEPVKDKIDARRVYRGIFGGLFWAFIVSSHNSTFNLKDLFLNEDGKLKIIRDRGASKRFMQRLVQDFGSNDKNLEISVK